MPGGGGGGGGGKSRLCELVGKPIRDGAPGGGGGGLLSEPTLELCDGKKF